MEEQKGMPIDPAAAPLNNVEFAENKKEEVKFEKAVAEIGLQKVKSSKRVA